MAKRNYSTIDKEVYSLVLQKKALNLVDITKEIDLSEDRAIKSLERLEKRGKIQKEKVILHGKYTTVAKVVDNFGMKVKARKNKLVWNTFGNLPCFTCPAISKCKIGVGSKDQKDIANPLFCDYIRDYLKKSMRDEKYDKIFQPDFEDIKKKRGRKSPEEEEEKK